MTAPGTFVSNVATATFTQEGVQRTVSSNTAVFQVLELVDARVQWNDAAPVGVSSPDTARALVFTVINLGNARHTFILNTRAQPGLDFEPVPASPTLYLESGAAQGLQRSGPDADVSLMEGFALDIESMQSRIVYALADMPASAELGARGALALTARSAIRAVQGSPVGAVLPGAGTGGLDLVVGHFAGTASDRGLYEVRGVVVSTAKRVASVIDIRGGASASPGSLITYEISVLAQGRGELEDLLIEDALPAELAYVPGSLFLDGVALPDGPHVNNNRITVSLGRREAPFSVSLRLQARIR